MDRLDAREHIEGRSVFGIDVTLPDILYAAVLQAPVYGGEVIKYNKSAIAGKDITAIVPVSHGIAVVAKSWWEAKSALDSLDVHFSVPAGMENLSSDEISREMSDAIKAPGIQEQREGKPVAAMDSSQIKVNDSFETPFYDHAAMEPMNCTAHVTKDKCEIWAPTQCAGQCS